MKENFLPFTADELGVDEGRMVNGYTTEDHIFKETIQKEDLIEKGTRENQIGQLTLFAFDSNITEIGIKQKTPLARRQQKTILEKEETIILSPHVQRAQGCQGFRVRLTLFRSRNREISSMYETNTASRCSSSTCHMFWSRSC